ncbi:hypothetical protein SKAU_G00245570 [Synaphobranchus kaupii]|uniref:Uncharacterized protein n=1 Tax=Synaphobranchus kaupii TaxID=118154 RepID=A0A9Q1F282_SYNKA|nr:hypothetical protein SKAU_G00245570 [Synaphobranchus kaupii]
MSAEELKAELESLQERLFAEKAEMARLKGENEKLSEQLTLGSSLGSGASEKVGRSSAHSSPRYWSRKRKPSQCERLKEEPQTLELLRQWERVEESEGVWYRGRRDQKEGRVKQLILPVSLQREGCMNAQFDGGKEVYTVVPLDESKPPKNVHRTELRVCGPRQQGETQGPKHRPSAVLYPAQVVRTFWLRSRMPFASSCPTATSLMPARKIGLKLLQLMPPRPLNMLKV